MVLIAAGVALQQQLPVLGASGLLYPFRRPVNRAAPPGCDETEFAGAGVRLQGWRCPGAAPRRGTIVYLHGIADTRTSSVPVIKRFVPRGFDVLAYDGRAHGRSGGDVCSYGVHERRDLRRVLDTLSPGPVVVVGHSLGAAIALQAAGEDARIAAVVAAETFSSLRAVATDRAPFVFSAEAIEEAFRIAELKGGFPIDAASPLAAAPAIRVPVLLLHGAADTETRPSHSERVYAALAGPKRLILLPGTGHAGSLNPATWREIETWVGSVVPRP